MGSSEPELPDEAPDAKSGWNGRGPVCQCGVVHFSVVHERVRRLADA